MIYREIIERWIRRLRAAQHLKHRADRAKLKKKDNND
jgi:hypothetical protein